MLDDRRLGELETRGWTRVPAVVDADTVADMLDRTWVFLESRGIRRDDAATWPEKVGKLQPLRNADVFDAFLGDHVDRIADQLMGVGRWTTLGVRPQALITMPTSEAWHLPHKVWHFDLPARGPTDRLAALRLFGLVDDVAPRGGGTLVVEGSHELVRQLVEAAPDHDAGGSSDVRATLRAHEFFAALNRPEPDVSTFMDAGAIVDGVSIRVAEITGTAGDLVVMHPWLMHNLSMNCGDRPRVAMSHSLYSTGVSFHKGRKGGEP